MRVLLVAAGLCVGASESWADWTTVYSNDYTNASTYDAGWTNGNSGRISWGQWSRPDLAESVTDKTAMRVYMNSSSNGSSATFNGLSSVSAYTSSEQYKIEFDFGLTRGTNQNPSFVIYASDNSTVLVTFQATTSAGKRTFTTKAGNEGTFYSASEVYNSFNLTDNSPAVFNHVVIEADGTNGTKITVSSDGGGTEANVVAEHTVAIDASMLYVGKMVYNTGRYNSNFAIDNLTVSIYSDTEIVPNPSAAITGVDGSDRTVTMTLGTGSSEGSVVKYYTDADNKSDLTTYSAPFTVSSSSTIYYYTESTSGATSEVQSIDVTCEALTLHAPTFSRNGNTVTITSDQSDLDASPIATIYYKYNSDNFAVYNDALTVTADATITAYTAYDGYTQSSNVTRAVALLPTAGVTQIENSPYTTDYSSSAFSDETTTTDKATYAALNLTKNETTTQWGTNVYLQTTGWGIRNNGGWYTNSASSVWILMKSMKAGDIIIAQLSKAASGTVNATYSEKYSRDGYHAYIVDADGDVELGFTRVSSKDNNYFSGIYAYTHNVTGTQVGAFDNTTEYMAATSEKVTLKPGESYHYNFKNYNSGGNGNWNNFLLAAYDGSDNVKAVVRADNFEVIDWKNTGCTNDFNWTNFVSKMNGATVDMTVSYSASNVLSMAATITTNEETPSTWSYSYTSDYTGSGISLSGDIKIALSVDHAWLDIISEGKGSIATTITSAGWATLYTPYALDFSSLSEDLTAYTATCSESTVTLTKVNNVPASTGVVLKGAANTYNIPVIASSETAKGHLLGSATEATAYDAYTGYTLYMLKMVGENAQFVPMKSGSLAAGKAYLKIASGNSSLARSLNVVFADEATGIQTVQSEGVAVDGYYNLSGQRVSQPTKGLYIVNGKKVLVNDKR